MVSLGKPRDFGINFKWGRFKLKSGLKFERAPKI